MPSKAGSVANRWKNRHFPKTEVDPITEVQQGSLRALFRNEDFAVFEQVIGAMAKRARGRIFSDAAPEQDRLDEAFKIRLLRDIMSTLYAKAGMPMPEKLNEVLS